MLRWQPLLSNLENERLRKCMLILENILELNWPVQAPRFWLEHRTQWFLLPSNFPSAVKQLALDNTKTKRKLALLSIDACAWLLTHLRWAPPPYLLSAESFTTYTSSTLPPSLQASSSPGTHCGLWVSLLVPVHVLWTTPPHRAGLSFSICQGQVW